MNDEEMMNMIMNNEVEKEEDHIDLIDEIKEGIEVEKNEEEIEVKVESKKKIIVQN